MLARSAQANCIYYIYFQCFFSPCALTSLKYCVSTNTENMCRLNQGFDSNTPCSYDNLNISGPHSITVSPTKEAVKMNMGHINRKLSVSSFDSVNVRT